MFASFLASIEMAFSSSQEFKIASLEEKGKKGAKRILKLLHSFDDTLTGILVWINITHMAYETVITLAVVRTWGAASTFIAVIVSAILISVIGEIVPKVLVANKSEEFIVKNSLLLSFLLKLVWPLTKVFSATSLFLAHPFLKDKKTDNSMEEEDLEDLAREASNSGEIEKDTENLVLEALDFDDKQVQKCMQPWSQIQTVSESDTPEAIYDKIKDSIYSRLPVIDENGEVKGVLNATLFLRRYYLSGNDANVKNSITRAFFVNKDENLDELLSLMSENKIHMAIVHERNGRECKYLGIITLEDVLEELVGEIYDESDTEGKTDELKEKNT